MSNYWALYLTPTKVEIRKVIPCHPKISRQANPPVNTPAQDPIQGSEHAVEPSGPKGDNPATAGPGPTKIRSGTPENRLGRINPPAPEDANTTPGTTREK